MIDMLKQVDTCGLVHDFSFFAAHIADEKNLRPLAFVDLILILQPADHLLCALDLNCHNLSWIKVNIYYLLVVLRIIIHPVDQIWDLWLVRLRETIIIKLRFLFRWELLLVLTTAYYSRNYRIEGQPIDPGQLQ